MIDLNRCAGKRIFDEFNDEQRKQFFELRRDCFLQNIDTFYYSVKLKNDFRANSTDPAFLAFCRFFQRRKLDRYLLDGEIDGVHELYFCPNQHFLLYNLWIECPEYFDILITTQAPKSPTQADEMSVTSEIIVQIRSYYLWMYGVVAAFERSYSQVQAICRYFNLEIDHVQENRVDFCWHTNYLQDPENFFRIDRLARMKQTTFRDVSYHYWFHGDEDEVENNYIAFGNRKNATFLRIYLKTREVVETSKKVWFFKCWREHGLINEFDKYCLEKAYEHGRDWNYIHKARLMFYLEYGSDENHKEVIRQILSGELQRSYDDIAHYADTLVPRVTKVLNVEYQVKRVTTKTYDLIPFDNSSRHEASRIYDFFDNRVIICEYLTRQTFRLVKLDGDSNKSRRDLCPFWEKLRKTKFIDSPYPESEIKLFRKYTHERDVQLAKDSMMKKACMVSLINHGDNAASPVDDLLNAVVTLNDNDIARIKSYKKKRARELNSYEFTGCSLNDDYKRFSIIDKEDGTLYDSTSLG